MKNAVPFGTVVRYQNRPSWSQVGEPSPGDERRRGRAEESLGASVVVGGELAGLLGAKERQRRREDEEGGEEGAWGSEETG